MLVPSSLRRVAFPWSLAAMCLVAAAPFVHAEGINLSWNECGVQGDPLQTFACDSNSGVPFELVASFVPPAGITQLTGVQGDIRVSGLQFPDWWRLGTGQCRGFSSLVSSMNFTAGPTVCADPWNGLASPGVSYILGFYGTNTARIRVTGYMTTSTVNVNTETEYYAFKVLFTRAKSTGAGSCGGCGVPMSLTFEQLQLFQAAGANPILTAAANSKVANWQGVPAPPPVVSSFTPGSGNAGAPVTIGGANFTGASSVRFDTTAALFTVDHDGQITAAVPARARYGPIHVTTPNGAGVSAAAFEPLPTFRYFVPHQAPVGEYVAIVGDNLAGISEITFNGTTALTVALRSDTLIQARVPEGATTGPITLRSGAATTTSAATFTVGPWLEGVFDLAWNDCGAAGPPLKTFACNTNTGTPFQFYGSFIPPPDVIRMVGFAATMRVGGDPLPDWWRFGPGECRDAGALLADYDFTSGPFTCRDPWAGSRVGSVQYDVGYFGANTARLLVSAFGPAVAANPDSEYYAFRVTLGRANTVDNGSCAGCASAATVTLQKLELFQDENLWFNPPPITTAIRNYTIEWQGGSVPKPEVLSFTPPAGPAATSVRIVGDHFNTANGVAFGNKVATFTVESDTVIHADAPDSVLTGLITVTSPTGTGASLSSFVGPPMIGAVAPGRARIGQIVHLTGFNLGAPIAVEFAGLPASSAPVSSTALDGVVPPGAVDGWLIATNAAGADTATAMFAIGTPLEAGINLSWDDCGEAGAALKTWTCDSNTGPAFSLVASFIPPAGIASFTGVTAEVRFAAQGALPDWWRHGTGLCRGTASLLASADFTAGPSTCVDPFAGGAAGGFTYDFFPDPHRARLRVQYGLPAQDAAALAEANEYYAFRVNVTRSKTTGNGSCVACLTPVCITLNEMQLVQESDPDVLLTLPLFSNSAYWQSQQDACLTLTPVQVSLIRAEAKSDGVHLVWELPRGDAAMLQRREGEGEWRTVTRLTPDGEHRLEYIDRDVRGGTYGYRLVIVVQGEEILAGETTVFVPTLSRTLAIGGLSWSSGVISASITLASGEPATLEIYDLGGRRFAARRLEGLQAGEHQVGVSAALHPGVYFGRMIQGSATASRRFAVVR